MKSRKIIFPFIGKHSLVFGDGPDGQEIITELLTNVYKLDAEAIGEILKDGATPTEILASIAAADKKRIADLTKKVGDTKYKEAYANAKKFERTNMETELKDHYGVDSDLVGTALYDHIVATKQTEGGAKTEDEIKKSPTYIAMEKKLKGEAKKLADDHAAKITEMETTYKKEGVFTKVGANALDILAGLNPILPKNATVADTYRRDFLNELKGWEYEQHEDGTIVVMKDGKVLDDGHGNSLEWEAHVKNIAERRFEFEANNGGKNSGAGGDADKNKGKDKKDKTPGAYPAGVEKPKNATELSAAIRKEGLTTEDKRTIMDEYKKRVTE